MSNQKALEIIKAYRSEKNMTWQAIGKELGFSVNYLYRLLDGSRQPGYKFWGAISAHPELSQRIGIALIKGETK
jgi:hypothetical protein